MSESSYRDPIAAALAQPSDTAAAERLRFDAIVIGAGTAGCVLASRLSEDPGRQVLLVEAGPDFGHTADGRWPADLLTTGYVDTEWDWGYVTRIAGRTHWYKRGRVIGGSSSINATGINWGLVEDYDAWRDLGNPGWGFDDLLPYFHRVERLVNDEAPSRGTAGRLPVTRSVAPESPYFADLARAYEAAGLSATRDVSGPHARTGYGQGTRNNLEGQRYSAARAYLDDARDRPNLTILADTLADLVLWSGSRARGVRLRHAGRNLEAWADRVVLAAGAIGSPLLLMRSGIGPAEHLRAVLGRRSQLHDLPGVGRNLHDHFGVSFGMLAAPGAMERLQRTVPAGSRSSLVARVKSHPGLSAFDLDVFATQGLAGTVQPDEDVFGWSIFLVHPVAVGYLELTGPHLGFPPHIETGFGDRHDLQAIARCIVWLRELVQRPELATWYAAEAFPGPSITGEALEQYILEHARLFHHSTGTCRMGPAGNVGAVVDQAGRVHGFENIYVADAAIMPRIPRGMINLSVYAIAEKIAAGLTA